MKKNAKKILIMIFIIIIAGVSVIGFNRALPVEVVTITPVTAEMYFIEQGYVKPQDTVEIYPQVSGEILSVNVTEGQSIEKGDILCSADPG